MTDLGGVFTADLGLTSWAEEEPAPEATPAAGCGVTVLRCDQWSVATKTHRRVQGTQGWATAGYKAGTYFSPAEYRFDDLRGLGALIDDLRRDNRSFIIRGELLPDVRAALDANPHHRIRRLKNPERDKRTKAITVAATIADAPRRWVMLDVDSWRMPEWADLADDPEAVIEAAIYALLPEAFHDADCYWQLSASAGFVPGILKAHLFYWLSEPVSSDHLRRTLAQHLPGVDKSPCNAVQAHYIADPVVVDAYDPLPRRTGFRTGLDRCVVLPAVAAKRQYAATNEASRQAVVTDASTPYGARLLQRACDAISGAPSGEKHATLNRTAFTVGGWVAGGEIAEAEGRAALAVALEAIRECCADYSAAERTLDKAFEDGMGQPLYAQAVAAVAPPTNAPTRICVTDARDQVRAWSVKFYEQKVLRNEFDTVWLARFTTGVGKSVALLEEGSRALVAMRERGDDRVLVIAVPTHTLGQGHADGFDTLPAALGYGLTAAVWRGIFAIDEDGVPMCQDHDAARDAMIACASVQTAVCENGHAKCEHFATCRYQAQRARKADMWFCAHELLFQPAPSTFGSVAGLVVDESAWQDGLINAEIKKVEMEVTLDSLSVGAKIPGREDATLTLQDARYRALVALRDAPLGPVTRGTFIRLMEINGQTIDTSLTAATAHTAADLEWCLKEQPELTPGMPWKARKAEVERVIENRNVSTLSAMWRALAALLAENDPDFNSGWLTLATTNTKAGPSKVIRIKGRKDVHESWHVPTMHLDATANVELLRWHWPAVELVADIDVTAPYQFYYQTTGSNHPSKGYTAGSTAPRNLRELSAQIWADARAYYPREILIVPQKDVEDALRARGRLPPNVLMAHYNDIEGRNEFSHVAAVIKIGRIAPPPEAVERLAECLSGRAVERVNGWYPQAQRYREMVDGTWQQAEGDCHPHALAEAVRWHACEGQLLQTAGRGRGVNRDAGNPLDIINRSDVSLPIPCTAVVGDASLRPSLVHVMLAEGGIAFKNPTDAASAYPSIWENREAAKKALEREVGDKALEVDPLLKRSVPNLAPVTYQRRGAGKRPVQAIVDLVEHPDPAAAIAAVLGPLAWCRRADEPHPPPTPEPHPTTVA